MLGIQTSFMVCTKVPNQKEKEKTMQASDFFFFFVFQSVERTLKMSNTAVIVCDSNYINIFKSSIQYNGFINALVAFLSTTDHYQLISSMSTFLRDIMTTSKIYTN